MSAPPVRTTAQRRVTRAWRTSRLVGRLRRSRSGTFGAGLIALFALVALFAPLLAPPGPDCLRDLHLESARQLYTPVHSGFWRAWFAAPRTCSTSRRVSFAATPTPPSAQAYFGTSQGYDLFHALVWGTRTMFKLALTIVGVTLLLGVLIGAVSGYYGGWADNLIQRFIDVLFALPGLVLTIVLVTFLRTRHPGLDPTVPIILAYTATGWASYARVVRGEVLRTRQLAYVDAARALGSRDGRLILRHVLPNSLTSVLPLAVLDLGAVPLSVAALSFLGLGFPPGYAEWGQLVDYARAWLQLQYWYVITFPGVFILLFSLGFNLLGDALQEAMDPTVR